MKDNTKATISFFLTLIIVIICCLYTYSNYNLPGREKQITITSASQKELSIPKLVDKYKEYNKIGADFNPIAREIGVHFEGKIKIKQVIIENDGRVKLISDDEYNDFGKTPEGAKLFFENGIVNRYFVIYLKDKIQNYYDFTEKEIKFSGDFYSIDNRYITVINGEIL